MTETEWMACPHPTPMLEFMRDRASNRKLQLFACACCHRLLGLFPNAAIQQAIEFSERDADQVATPEQWVQAERVVTSWLNTQNTLDGSSRCTRAENSAVWTAKGLTQRRPMTRFSLAVSTARDARRAVYEAANNRRALQRAAAEDIVGVARATWQAAQSAYEAERQAQAVLLRDILGNPFRPVIPDPA
jgi:membrane protein involved in colicin uptake